MSLGRVLVEEFQPEVVQWLRERVDLVVVNPWVEPERWELEVVRVDAVISRKGKITRQQMQDSAGRLKLIARTGVGVDPSRVDLYAAKEYKIWVTNMPGSNAVSVAELAIGQMIALARHTIEANQAVKDNRWSDYVKYIGAEVAQKTLGIIGMGNIGTRVALRARAFEMHLLVYDPYIPESHVTALGGQWIGLDDLLSRADFVTVHCPLNEETSKMLGARELALMKKNAYLVNLARGAIIDQQALEDALRRGSIRAAGLDVFEEEPLPANSSLLELENVVLLPHLGSATIATRTKMGMIAVENILAALEGKKVPNLVNA
jgi:D-3-phosphoglycerate dehydrogenase / 2-oxoglutarate reductase